MKILNDIAWNLNWIEFKLVWKSIQDRMSLQFGNLAHSIKHSFNLHMHVFCRLVYNLYFELKASSPIYQLTIDGPIKGVIALIVQGFDHIFKCSQTNISMYINGFKALSPVSLHICKFNVSSFCQLYPRQMTQQHLQRLSQVFCSTVAHGIQEAAQVRWYNNQCIQERK